MEKVVKAPFAFNSIRKGNYKIERRSGSRNLK